MILTHTLLGDEDEDADEDANEDEDEDEDEHTTLRNSRDKIVTFFGINTEQLHIIIDILTSNPYKIFKFKDDLPEINIDTLTVKGNFDEKRLALLSGVLKMPIKDVSKLSAIWLYNQELLTKGERYLEKIAKDLFNISPGILKILVKSHGVLTSKINQEDFRKELPGFIIEQLESMREEIKEQGGIHYEFPSITSKFIEVFNKEFVDFNRNSEITDSGFKSPFMNDHDITPINMIDFSITIAKLVTAKDMSIFKKILDGDDIGDLL
jgi:hypothetical protein